MHGVRAVGLRPGGRTLAHADGLLRVPHAGGYHRKVLGDPDYKPGDIAIMDFPNNKVPTDHCGIVTAVTPVGVRTIEGNTAMGNDSNGGQVMERERMYGVILGAVRPEYDMEETMEEKRYNTVEECPDWAQGTVKKLVRLAYLNGSGKGLDLSRDMLRILVIQDRAGQFGS